MAKLKKNNITYMPVVEGISRKFTLRSDKATSPAFEGYMGAVSTVKSLTGIGAVRKNWFFMRKAAFVTAQSEDAINARNRFTNVSQGIKTIMRDLSQITDVQQLFLQTKNDQTKTINGVHNYGFSSVRSWAFAVQYAGLLNDSHYNVNQFPAAVDA